ESDPEFAAGAAAFLSGPDHLGAAPGRYRSTCREGGQHGVTGGARGGSSAARSVGGEVDACRAPGRTPLTAAVTVAAPNAAGARNEALRHLRIQDEGRVKGRSVASGALAGNHRRKIGWGARIAESA